MYTHEAYLACLVVLNPHEIVQGLRESLFTGYVPAIARRVNASHEKQAPRPGAPVVAQRRANTQLSFCKEDGIVGLLVVRAWVRYYVGLLHHGYLRFYRSQRGASRACPSTSQPQLTRDAYPVPRFVHQGVQNVVHATGNHCGFRHARRTALCV
jgi:hypothetical protein